MLHSALLSVAILPVALTFYPLSCNFRFKKEIFKAVFMTLAKHQKSKHHIIVTAGHYGHLLLLTLKNVKSLQTRVASSENALC